MEREEQSGVTVSLLLPADCRLLPAADSSIRVAPTKEWHLLEASTVPGYVHLGTAVWVVGGVAKLGAGG